MKGNNRPNRSVILVITGAVVLILGILLGIAIYTHPEHSSAKTDIPSTSEGENSRAGEDSGSTVFSTNGDNDAQQEPKQDSRTDSMSAESPSPDSTPGITQQPTGTETPSLTLPENMDTGPDVSSDLVTSSGILDPDEAEWDLVD